MVAHPSLSVVIPVHNAEQTLAARITQLLDILPDLTTNFEVLVINDGSIDHTEEIAYELAREYPQIRVAHHEMRRGERGAVETGLAQTSGDILFIQDEHAPLDSSKLHRLWELRNEEELVLAQTRVRKQRGVLQRLAAWGVRLEDSTADGGSSGVQMIRRPLTDRNAMTAKGFGGLRSRTDQAQSPPKAGRPASPTVRSKRLL